MNPINYTIATCGFLLLVSTSSLCAADATNLDLAAAAPKPRFFATDHVDPPNVYVTADVGAIFQQDANFTENAFPTVNATFNTGIRVDLILGYTLNDNWAVELEPGFTWNSVESLDGVSLGSVGESIDLYQVPILCNVVYRFTNKTAFTPYLGGGIGADVGFFKGTLPGATVNDTAASFAYGGKAGVRFTLSKNASVDLEYQVLGTTDQDYSFNTAHNHKFTDQVTFNGIVIHGVFVSFTWDF